MKTVGIIAEYNPFHNGHLYQMEEARRLTGADRVVVVMGGSFMQRGIPAVMDKYLRTETALSCGADLVLELPVCYACASAEYFARGAVALMDRLGAVDYLCFGSECGEIAPLKRAAFLLGQETDLFRDTLKRLLGTGMPYPQARETAYEFALAGWPYDAAGGDIPSVGQTGDTLCPPSLLSSPNNILGIEYLKALRAEKSSIIPHTLKRTGNSYHDEALGASKSSALAVRKALREQKPIAQLRTQIPEKAYRLIKKYYRVTFPLFPGACDQILHYKLLMDMPGGYEAYADISRALSDRIRNLLPSYSGFDSFCDAVKTKNMTRSRISRGLLHILLGLKTETLAEYMADGIVRYARILGFRHSAADLLGAIKRNTSIPLISKLADADRILSQSPTGKKMLDEDIRSAHIYNLLVQQVYGYSMRDEYRREIIRIP